MGTIPLTIASLCYIWQIVLFLKQGNWGMALAFGGYVLANAGIIWSYYYFEGVTKQ